MEYITKKTSIIMIIVIGIVSCSPSARYNSYFRNDRQKIQKGEVVKGRASYYGTKFHGRKTANGEIFDMYKISAAHKQLPFGSIVEVTNMANGKVVVVRINDRGPFKAGRILDLSYQAAKAIDMIKDGVVDIKMKILKIGEE